ncbi:glutaredoxin [Candidatus Peregrinibacteria bacterium CG22_combo_CG10-13_8_21_14_all_44_10]|nr:MAG: hypothetical protein AUK45_04480 [Candidatus Peregrinibacteria bacterium CG2_30_44_17]PIP66541.1 MAG: glutaredoxin [Candidatus Peregrinibacteria bacterium CG22_combo_CG10-13_8_21_14_all_44_10]PIS03723.1 MAG: glutaredoxin [Candidatus Peregrinibacteria bacterium CG10_big_fil_rev_8_21_14_0_10_44_7]PIX79039.1 MAG: glutaredoxin [Candidatus Peregrinibacteria bacterium CG_4_10_14_3_um_filter_44_21]PJB89238.1 MAG: glutaredoxin [Candidatus Peregrinibacteria bacterium CG_4_9_14_0_8_um_filter_44_1
MLRNLTISILISSILVFPLAFADNAIPELTEGEEAIQFSVFTRETCSHCQELEEFLSNDFDVEGVQAKLYHLEEDDTYELFTEFCDENGLVRATPTILIGDTIVQGFQDADSTGAYIMELASAMTESSYFEDYESGNIEGSDEVVVHLPLLGTVDLKEYSIGILAVVLGFVDGFNPCAMWVLIMFITLLSQSGNKRKMFELAGIFVLAETIMYYMILNVWYKTWDFVKLDEIITPIIGVISIGAGAYFLYEFFANKDNTCQVTSLGHKNKIKKRIEELVSSPLSIGIFFSTLFLALSVNVIEFACSIGIPQAFTKILDLNDLSWVLRQVYVIIYTFFYMVDDFIVFAIALWSFEHLHLTTKYTRYCLIIGGVIMLILGYFFIFDPSKLVL